MWNLNKQERLLAWQSFRKSLDSMSLDDCVKTVNKHWWTAPISTQFFSQTLPEQWPDPWQLIVDNFYDDIARALGMLYTIYYSKHDCDAQLVCGMYEGNEYNLVLINGGKYTLNWDTACHVNTPLHKKLTNVKCFAAEQLVERYNNESNNTSNKTQRQQRVN